MLGVGLAAENLRKFSSAEQILVCRKLPAAHVSQHKINTEQLCKVVTVIFRSVFL